MKSQSSRWQGERRQVRHQQHANGTDSSSSHRVIFSEEWEEWGCGGATKEGSVEKGQKGTGGLVWPMQPPVTWDNYKIGIY